MSLNMKDIPKVIIDTDPGTDDAAAICLMLAAHKRKIVEIIAITTVCGNSGIDNTTYNTLKILYATNCFNIPVYEGSRTQLVIPFTFKSMPFHGYDGFGDVGHHFEHADPKLVLQNQPAAATIVNLINKYQGDIILLALGPMTNVAVALALDATLTSKLRGFYAMGGNTMAIGNITNCAEFNFHCDPEAAKVVLDRTEIPIKLVPWELCNNLSYDLSVRKALRAIISPVADLLNKIEENVMDKPPSENVYIICDQIAAAWLIHDFSQKDGKNKFLCNEFIQEIQEVSATVELHGEYTRGQMVIMREDKNRVNVFALEKFNTNLCLEYIKDVFTFFEH